MLLILMFFQTVFASPSPNWTLTFQADDRIGLQLERVNGTFKSAPSNVYWHPDGYILKSLNGYQSLDVSGAQY